MNAYFASVEQQVNSYYRNKPLAITPTFCSTGCIITSSYEARKYGIKTGMLIKQALKIYPYLICRESNTNLYLDYHQKIIDTILQITPFFSVRSIDELVIKISPKDQNLNNCINLAKKIKNNIYKKVGECLSCSIGIASNDFLAKTAADYQKPDGLTIIKNDNIKFFLKKLKLNDLCGINYRMQKQFNKLNIYTPLDLYNTSIQNLKQMLGKIGQYWFLNIHGYDYKSNLISKISLPKTISQSHILPPKLRDWKNGWIVCQKLIFKACFRLRKKSLITNKVYLHVRYTNNKYFNYFLIIDKNSNSFFITKYMKYMWNKINKYNKRPFKICIIFSNLQKSLLTQNNLFNNQINKQINIFKTIDSLNKKYNEIIYPATQIHSRKFAPDRISFGNPKI